LKSKIVNNPEFQSIIRILESWISTQIVERGVAGLSIAIIYDQDILFAKGFGFSDIAKKIPATKDTIYRIASNTKLFTSTAIMQLRDAKKLKLDDPISKYLPWFKIKTPQKNALPITIRHILTHTSGLPREAAFSYWDDYKFPTIEEIIETLPDQERSYIPEKIWKYSNLAMTLLGEIISNVSSKTYENYIQKNILDPLEMTNTSVFLKEDHRKRLATGYGRRKADSTFDIEPFTDSKGITPAANMSSTVEDLGHFISLQFRDEKAGGKQILRGSTLREMHRVHWLHPNWKGGWGLGFCVRRLDDLTLNGHGGSLGGYRTETTFCAAEKIGVVVLTNVDNGNPKFFIDRIFRVLTPVVKNITAPPKKEKTPDPYWENYIGKYRNTWRDAEILLYDGNLVMIDPTDTDPFEDMVKFIPVKKNTFRLEGNSGYLSIGELVTFEMDENDKVKGVKAGNTHIYPIDLKK
jgi:CubicO group peptidase (beta-lactamase class C family)